MLFAGTKESRAITTGDTPSFGLTRVGQGEDLSKGGYKALDKDRMTLDSILKALATHNHAGQSAVAPADIPPTVSAASSGGTLPAGVTYNYSVGYVDQYGLETAASPAVTVSTAPAVAPPSSVLLTATSGGTLHGGLYSYAVTFVQTTGGESTASPAYSLTIDGSAGANAIILNLPSTPGTGITYRIYRSRPGQARLYYLADTSSASYTDTGITEDSTRLTPNFNTTNAFQKITVTIPGNTSAPGSVPPGVKAWRIYRTDSTGQYSGANLVHQVVEPTTVGGSDLRVSWDDISASLIAGAPQSNNSTIAMPPQLSSQAFNAEPAVTNLVTNPSFETNTTGWTLVDTATPSTTFTRAQANAIGGVWAASLVGTVGAKDAYILFQVNIAASTTYTVSAYSLVSNFTAAAYSSRGMYITDGTSVVSTSIDSTAQYQNQWHRHVASITTASSATVLSIRLYAPEATTYWDSVQTEAGGNVTAYLDGSLGFNYAWTGTPNASTSTRTYGSTVIPELSVLNYISAAAAITAQNVLTSGVSTQTAAYTASLLDSVVMANAATAAFTVTLPAVRQGARIHIKKVDSSANVVTVSPASGTIDGAATRTLTTQYAAMSLVCDGVNWYVL